VAPSAAKQIRRNYEHTGRRYSITIIGYEDVDPRSRQGFLPDAFGTFSRLRDRAHLRNLKQRKERWQIREASKSGNRHRKQLSVREHPSCKVWHDIRGEQFAGLGIVPPIGLD
jgi:hypothetical protein